MNYIMSFVFIVFITACSHTGHDHFGHVNEHSDWSKTSKKISEDHKEATDVFQWFKEHVKEHENEISRHMTAVFEHEKKIKKMKNSNTVSIEMKKLTLEFSRKHDEISDEHRHFLKDHNKFMKLVSQLKILKEELETHEGHSH